MRRTAAWSITTAVVLAVARLLASPAMDQADDLMARLLSERRYFELKKLLESETGPVRPETLFYRGMVANAFNQVEDSIDYLTEYLQPTASGHPQTRVREALGVLADDYTKLFIDDQLRGDEDRPASSLRPSVLSPLSERSSKHPASSKAPTPTRPWPSVLSRAVRIGTVMSSR